MPREFAEEHVWVQSAVRTRTAQCSGGTRAAAITVSSPPKWIPRDRVPQCIPHVLPVPPSRFTSRRLHPDRARLWPWPDEVFSLRPPCAAQQEGHDQQLHRGHPLLHMSSRGDGTLEPASHPQRQPSLATRERSNSSMHKPLPQTNARLLLSRRAVRWWWQPQATGL